MRGLVRCGALLALVLPAASPAAGDARVPARIVDGGTQRPASAIVSTSPARPDPLGALAGDTSSGLSAGTPEFLPVNEAFRLDAQALGRHGVVLRWRIADGYYLYRDRISAATAEGSRGRGVSLALPAGESKEDPYFGTMQVYRHSVELVVDLSSMETASPLEVSIHYQGCADAGLCYPPQTRTVHLAPDTDAPARP